MKKVLRLIFSLTLLSTLAISQIPSPAACQMMAGGILSQSCMMPCCRNHMPMSKCPMMKTSGVRDFIASSSITFDTTLQPLHQLGMVLLPSSRRLVTLAENFAQTVQSLFFGSPPSVRAPPTDIHLQNA